MKISFLGAAKRVTCSNFLVEGAGKKFLVDCGMYQGQAKEEEKNFDIFAFKPEEIDFMVLETQYMQLKQLVIYVE